MKQPFRFQGREVFPDIKTQTSRVVPDADSKTLSVYERQMDQMFGDRRLPAVIYKGVTWPARNLGEFVEPLGEI